MATYVTLDVFNNFKNQITSGKADSSGVINLSNKVSAINSNENLTINEKNKNPSSGNNFFSIETDYNSVLNTKKLRGIRYDNINDNLQVFKKDFMNDKVYLGDYVDLHVEEPKKIKSYFISNDFNGQGCINKFTLLGKNNENAWVEIHNQNSLSYNNKVNITSNVSDNSYNFFRIVIHSINPFTSLNFPQPKFKFSNGAGGKGGVKTYLDLIGGGGGAGGINVSENNVLKSKMGSLSSRGVSQGGYGYGAGGGGPSGNSIKNYFPSLGGKGSSGFVYFNNSGIEYFNDSVGPHKYTCSKEGSLAMVLVGGGGGGSSNGKGGHSGQLSTFMLNVKVGDELTINIGDGGSNDTNGESTNVTHNSNVYSANGGLNGNIQFDNSPNTSMGGLSNKNGKGNDGSDNTYANLATQQVDAIIPNKQFIQDNRVCMSYTKWTLLDENDNQVNVSVSNQNDWNSQFQWVFNTILPYQNNRGFVNNYLISNNGNYSGSNKTSNESLPYKDYNLNVNNLNSSGQIQAVSFKVDTNSSWVPQDNKDLTTKKYVDDRFTNLVGGAGDALNTLKELSDALGNDQNYAVTITNSLSTKVNLAGGNTLSGDQTINGILDMGSNKVSSSYEPQADSDLANKKYVDGIADLKVNLAGGNTLSGDQTINGILDMGSNKVSSSYGPVEYADGDTQETKNSKDAVLTNKKYVDTKLSLKVNLAGGNTLSGDQTINGNLDMGSNKVSSSYEPQADSDLTNKLYVDGKINGLIDTAPEALNTLKELSNALNNDSNYATTITTSLSTKLNLAGGTMTGNIDMGSNKITSSAVPSTDSDLANKKYVDGKADLKVNLAGDTMTGNLSMGSNKITSTAVPSTDSDLTNKKYVEDKLALKVNLAGGNTLTGDQTITGNLTVNGTITVSEAPPSGTSDIRVKTNIVNIEDTNCLEYIDKFNVYKFDYKDNKYGNPNTIGFMANEVNDILPILVNKTQEYIPNINENIDSFDYYENNIIGINLSNNLTDINIGDQIKLVDNNQVKYFGNILDINNNYIKISMNSNLPANVKLLVYGTYVQDFKTLNYNSIFSLSVGAIKQLSDENKLLKEKLNSIENILKSNNLL